MAGQFMEIYLVSHLNKNALLFEFINLLSLLMEITLSLSYTDSSIEWCGKRGELRLLLFKAKRLEDVNSNQLKPV